MRTSTTQDSYNEFRESLRAKSAKELQAILRDKVLELTGFAYGQIPLELCDEEFVYAWYRYVRYRFHKFDEKLCEDSWSMTLESLMDEPDSSSRVECLRRSIVAGYKGVFPSCRRSETYIALHSSRSRRSAAQNGFVTDTVRRRRASQSVTKKVFQTGEQAQ